jgi:hypothetical protein
MEGTPRFYDTLVQVLSQHQNWVDLRHLKTLAWMLVGLIESGKISLTAWIPYVHSRAVYAQSSVRRFARWLENDRIDVHALYGPLMQQALAEWGNQLLYLALDTSTLWNTYCLVRIAIVYRGRAVPIVWKVLDHPSSSVAYDVYKDVLDTIKVYSVPSPQTTQRGREVPMPSYEEVTQRAGSLRSLTGLADAEFQALLPHFEQAFRTYMDDRTIDGQPRTSRRYTTYGTCPLPTIADKRLFILTYVKQHPIQEVQGQLCGMSQSNANKWIHVLHPVLNQALADQERLPARTAAEFADMFEPYAADGSSTPPLFGMMAPNVRFSARPIPKSNKNTTVARRSVTRAKTSS